MGQITFFIHYYYQRESAKCTLSASSNTNKHRNGYKDNLKEYEMANIATSTNENNIIAMKQRLQNGAKPKILTMSGCIYTNQYILALIMYIVIIQASMTLIYSSNTMSGTQTIQKTMASDIEPSDAPSTKQPSFFIFHFAKECIPSHTAFSHPSIKILDQANNKNLDHLIWSVLAGAMQAIMAQILYLFAIHFIKNKMAKNEILDTQKLQTMMTPNNKAADTPMSDIFNSWQCRPPYKRHSNETEPTKAALLATQSNKDYDLMHGDFFKVLAVSKNEFLGKDKDKILDIVKRASIKRLEHWIIIKLKSMNECILQLIVCSLCCELFYGMDLCIECTLKYAKDYESKWNEMNEEQREYQAYYLNLEIM